MCIRKVSYVCNVRDTDDERWHKRNFIQADIKNKWGLIFICKKQKLNAYRLAANLSVWLAKRIIDKCSIQK